MALRQFIVIGIGQFGESVVRTLAAEGCEVVAIDRTEDRIQDVKDFATQALVLDATDEKALASLGIADVDVVVIGIGRDLQASTLVALLCKELGAKLLVAKAVNRQQGKVLEKIGVDRVVYPETEIGARVAKSLASANILEHVQLSANVSIAEVVSPERFWDRTLAELNLRAKYGINVIALKRKTTTAKGTEEYLEQFPAPEDVILKDDLLLVFGANENIERLKKI